MVGSRGFLTTDLSLRPRPVVLNSGCPLELHVEHARDTPPEVQTLKENRSIL